MKYLYYTLGIIFILLGCLIVLVGLFAFGGLTSMLLPYELLWWVVGALTIFIARKNKINWLSNTALGILIIPIVIYMILPPSVKCGTGFCNGYNLWYGITISGIALIIALFIKPKLD